MPDEKKSLSRRSMFRHAALAGGLGAIFKMTEGAAEGQAAGQAPPAGAGR